VGEKEDLGCLATVADLTFKKNQLKNLTEKFFALC
jgi:hypothetical protein